MEGWEVDRGDSSRLSSARSSSASSGLMASEWEEGEGAGASLVGRVGETREREAPSAAAVAAFLDVFALFSFAVGIAGEGGERRGGGGGAEGRRSPSARMQGGHAVSGAGEGFAR